MTAKEKLRILRAEHARKKAMQAMEQALRDQFPEHSVVYVKIKHNQVNLSRAEVIHGFLSGNHVRVRLLRTGYVRDVPWRDVFTPNEVGSQR